MAGLSEYIKWKWKRTFATEAKDKFPAIDEHQKKYREDFGGIVDQYLIFYKDEERNGKHYKSIVFIDAENDIDWIDEGDNLSEDEMKKRNQHIALLDVVHASPVKNLSKREVVNFKKLLGVGYAAALYQNWDEVKMAIENAKQYRDERNKERSRLMLLSAATLYLFVVIGVMLLCTHNLPNHPHMDMFWGIVMGTIGAYVSIWTRYGKMDMTGLGTPTLHYLEAFARMLIGAIFATIIIFAFRSGIILNNFLENASARIIYSFIGFCAGFSEKFVPSVMEKFTNNTKKE